MKLSDLFKWGQKKLDAPFVSYFGQKFYGLLGANTNRKYLQEYRGWVFACVQARSEAVGNIELELYKGDKEVENHELLDLLFKVNPTNTKEDLFTGTQAFLDLEGNAFWFLARDNNGKGKIQEIWMLRPDRVSVVTDENNPLMVKGYVYHQPDGKKIPFEANQILHFKNFNPNADHPFPHRGIGIVEAASWAIDTDNEARQWNFSFFKNSARPDGFLIKEGTGTIAAEEFKRIKMMWEQEHQGSQNAHKPAILAGGLKWQDVARSQKDMDFIEQRRFSRDEILALFRTPKSVIGIVEDVNRANAEASNYIFALRTIQPLMQKIVSTLNEFLVPEFGDGLELAFESPVPADRLLTITEYEKGIDKWLTRNDIRRAEGLPPSENGDEIFGTLASVAIDSVKAPVKAAPKPSAKQQSAISKAIDKFVTSLPESKEVQKKAQLSELAIKNYIEIWKRSFGVETEPLKKKLDAFFKKQEAEVQKNIREQLKGLEVKEYKFKAVSDLMYDQENAIKTGIALITPNIQRYIRQAGEQAILLTGIGATFDDTNSRISDFVDSRAIYFSNTFNDTTAEKLLAELKLGLEADETTDELSARVSAFYDGEANYRSERAARTEVSASSNFAAQEAYTQAGVTKMQWLVVAPEDADCLANEGAIADVGDNFPSGDSAPPVHPNCVCTILPYFE